VPIETFGAVGAAPKNEIDAAHELAHKLVSTTCPACGHHVAAPFYDGGKQPLATVGWPKTSEEARCMPVLPLDFVRCTLCGHVFNTSFDYNQVPYAKTEYLTFNRGSLWIDFLNSVAAEVRRRLPPAPVVVEIGYGDGRFLDALSKDCPRGRFIGFDPHGAPAAAEGSPLELRRELFDPGSHLAALRPDLIVSRHVLEHLGDPLGFVQHISLAAACLDQRPLMYLEVPCIDRALETGRTEDFFYEHNSHFTTASFCRMLDRTGARLETLGHGYDGEVVYAFVRLDARGELVRNGLAALNFLAQADRSRQTISAQLTSLHESGKRVAFWGGTGRAAAFINSHDADAGRFPIVVDSDAAKAGTYVPGAGQLIRFRDWLVDNPVEVIVIPCQWRAADILREIQEHGIRYEVILIDHQGEFVSFHGAGQPQTRFDVNATNDIARLAGAVAPVAERPLDTQR
jgi:hypothetical protein